MLVAMVTCAGAPACATMCASRSCCLALSTSCGTLALVSSPDSSSDTSIEVVPTSTGWPRLWQSLMSSITERYFGPCDRKIMSGLSLRIIGLWVGITTTSRP